MMQSPRGPVRREILTWAEVDQLIDLLLAQLRNTGSYDSMILITRGGIIPGGMLAEALNVRTVLTAAVSFPAGIDDNPLAVWPEYLQFPEPRLLKDKNVLLVDDVWGSGRTSTSVRGRVEAAGGKPYTCVMHFNPYRSLFVKAKPDFYAAVTDAWIIYPWEVDRGADRISTADPLGSN